LTNVQAVGARRAPLSDDDYRAACGSNRRVGTGNTYSCLIVAPNATASSRHTNRPGAAGRNSTSGRNFDAEIVVGRTARASTLARNRHVAAAGGDLGTRIRNANPYVAITCAGAARAGHGDGSRAARRDRATDDKLHAIALSCKRRPPLARDRHITAGGCDLRTRLGDAHARLFGARAVATGSRHRDSPRAAGRDHAAGVQPHAVAVFRGTRATALPSHRHVAAVGGDP